MARKLKCNWNVDKLRISLTQPEGMWEKMSALPKGTTIQYDGFYIYIYDDGRGGEEMNEPTKVSANMIWTDGTEIGTIEFHAPNSYGGRAFFTACNRQLYTPFTTYFENGQKPTREPMVVCIVEVFDYLGMKIDTITQIDIAYDCNRNLVANCRKMISDINNYDMIVNGKVITDPDRKIEDYGEFFGRSRRRLERIPTLYFSQQSDRTPEIRIYNKSREIENVSNKNYITQWNGFGAETYYRSELTLYWRDIKKYLKNHNIDLCNPMALSQIISPQSLESIYNEITPRLIRFRGTDGSQLLPFAV